ncbi:hypothetical protein SBRCBS47491_003101 [Sporothrix bragantina]|uniref:Small subunit ribosomal protein S2 n=1 Tax=Sporothrix bragantina TaxID=671064 RepID=A0ABP0BCC1_9PEZI
MIVRNLLRQSRTQLATAPLSGHACSRAFLSTDATTPPPPTQNLAADATPSSQPPANAEASPDAATAAAPGPQRLAWGQRAVAPVEIANDYITMTKLQRKTNRIGSSVERRYSPGELIKNPPAPKDITLELLMASQAHIGHNTSLWNPANSRYIYGIREGVHIISLEQTAVHLRRAARVVEEVAYHGGLILFAGTRRGQMDMVVRAAELAGACHLFTKWKPGTITNRDTILQKASTRIVDEQDRDITAKGFTQLLGKQRPLTPDLVVVLNPLENSVLLRECALSTIPTIGIIDTDADPCRVTYAIPGNDDSLRMAAVVAGVLGRAGEMGQKRRLRDAKDGIVTWENSEEVARYMNKTNKALEGVRAPQPRVNRWPLSGGKIFK